MGHYRKDRMFRHSVFFSNCLAGFIDSQIIMTPSPALPLKEKGDQRTSHRCGLCAGILPLQGELEGVIDNDHFEHS